MKQQIPKIIHWCWLGDDPYPENVKECLASWAAKLPDWEVRLWGKECLEEIDEAWVHEAYEAKVYAHASDYIRLYAVYKYGGFYFDSDVEVLRDFSPLLVNSYVFGKENTSGNVEAATFGAVAGSPQIKRVMNWYHGRHFKNADGSYNYQMTMPAIIQHCFGKTKRIESVEEFDETCPLVQVFPASFFSPMDYVFHKMTDLTDETYSIHRFFQSWRRKRTRLAMFVFRVLGRKTYVLGCRLWLWMRTFSHSR